MAAALVVGRGSGVDGGAQLPEADMPERYLWAATLEQLIKDGKTYWLDTSKQKKGVIELEQAFDDMVRCGPMTRHCCAFLDPDPQRITEDFIGWCESTVA